MRASRDEPRTGAGSVRPAMQRSPDVPWIAVIGPGDATPPELEAAERVGAALASANVVLVCGGLSGVMEAACRGAAAHGGTSVGLLPGVCRGDANPFVTIAIPTGLGEARNLLVVRSADAVIAIGGGWGTLSEIGLARKLGKPVIGLDTWRLAAPASVDGLEAAQTPEEAVDKALDRCGHARHREA